MQRWCGGPGGRERRGRGKVARALLGLRQQEPSPRARRQTRRGPSPAGRQVRLPPAASGRAVSLRLCCTHIARLGLRIWDCFQLFILPLVALGSGCPSLTAVSFPAPSSGLSLLFCHSGNLMIDQPQLSRVVNGTSQTEGGWKPCRKSLS